ncbi:MAG TPA: tRNA pseudouridine(55) synthase TruB [Bacteroidales bacterium]|nr:tRNA pseudouridine(55) synthase TruB [Bacteroidales bacterium]
MIIDRSVHSLQGIDITQGHVLLIHKDKHWTSFDVVNKVRYMIKKTYNIKKIKVGHAGTLDPLATGVLVIGIGKETKNLESYQNQVKEYKAEITFGATTPSYDLETAPQGNFPIDHITKEQIEETLQQKFNGTIKQTPPIFSAKSVDGVRAYEAARKGKHVDIKPHTVTVYSSKLHSFEHNKALVSIVCSKGTYIRSIAHDLGVELSSGAYLSDLVRTKSGGFTIEQSITISDFEHVLEYNNEV